MQGVTSGAPSGFPLSVVLAQLPGGSGEDKVQRKLAAFHPERMSFYVFYYLKVFPPFYVSPFFDFFPIFVFQFWVFLLTDL